MTKLSKLRDEAGLTQKVIALDLNISQNTYSQYENGKREPSLNLLPKLAKILGCSIEQIVLCFCEE